MTSKVFLNQKQHINKQKEATILEVYQNKPRNSPLDFAKQTISKDDVDTNTKTKCLLKTVSQDLGIFSSKQNMIENSPHIKVGHMAGQLTRTHGSTWTLGQLLGSLHETCMCVTVV